MAKLVFTDYLGNQLSMDADSDEPRVLIEIDGEGIYRYFLLEPSEIPAIISGLERIQKELKNG